MSGVRIIDEALLDRVSEQARNSPRRRKNLNFHAGDTDVAHRLLNAIEPGSYVQPHRHLDPAKDECVLILRGKLGAMFFDDDGNVIQSAVLEAGGERVGVDFPHGTWHTFFALAPGTVVFECKAGPYLPLTTRERAPWAPAEGEPEAACYLEELLTRLG